MTDLNMDLKDLTRDQKIAMGVGFLLLVGYVGTTLTDSNPSSSSYSNRSSTPVVSKTKPVVSKTKPVDDSDEAASNLAGGPRQADQIRRIAARHKVGHSAVADKAAKVAELCGQNGFPGNAIGWSHGSLQFVDEITEPIDLDEAFVMYVLMKCPT